MRLKLDLIQNSILIALLSVDWHCMLLLHLWSTKPFSITNPHKGRLSQIILYWHILSTQMDSIIFYFMIYMIPLSTLKPEMHWA